MNNIELSTVYLPILDEVYKEESKTSILDGDETTVQKGNNGEIKIAKLDMDALGDFDRNTGYTKGSTKFTWETVRYDKERSQELRIDRLDNDEALKAPFARLSSEFLRTKVIPETDAARFAKLASAENIGTSAETLDTGEKVVASLRKTTGQMDDAEVPTESRILFITSTMLGLVEDLDTTKSKKVLEGFSQIIKVPQTRFYTAITLNDGTENYGFRKADGGYPLNYMVVEKSAAVTAMDQYIKYFTPDQDQNGDDNVFKYRNNNLYGHCYENKRAGIHASYDNSAQ